MKEGKAMIFLVRRADYHGTTVTNVYAIRRNSEGQLVYHLLCRKQVSPYFLARTQPDQYATAFWASHTRLASSDDLRKAAGLDLDTPAEVVKDWWDENLPLDTKAWRRLERRRRKAERVAEAVERQNAGVWAEALLSAD